MLADTHNCPLTHDQPPHTYRNTGTGAETQGGRGGRNQGYGGDLGRAGNGRARQRHFASSCSHNTMLLALEFIYLVSGNEIAVQRMYVTDSVTDADADADADT